MLGTRPGQASTRTSTLTPKLLPSLVFERRIRATSAKIYSAWTQPEQLICWFGSDAGPTLCAEADVRVGGCFHLRFRTLDGEEHEVRGVYREVVSPRRLSFTWTWAGPQERQSLVTVALEPDGDATLLRLTHEQIVDDPVHDYRRGWIGALDKLEQLFA